MQCNISGGTGGQEVRLEINFFIYTLYKSQSIDPDDPGVSLLL